jgi:hypothetical protein
MHVRSPLLRAQATEMFIPAAQDFFVSIEGDKRKLVRFCHRAAVVGVGLALFKFLESSEDRDTAFEFFSTLTQQNGLNSGDPPDFRNVSFNIKSGARPLSGALRGAGVECVLCAARSGFVSRQRPARAD